MVKNQKVKYIKEPKYGTGIIKTVFQDESILVHFKNKECSHPDCRNLYRYYKDELKNFEVL